jgi:hypothetical protein
VPERVWGTRDYEAADETGILALRRAVFGELDPVRLRPEVWRWQFRENPAGMGYVRLAEHAGEIVGQYAAVPTRFRVDDGEGGDRVFAMSCDTMTHPGYQKQGMFVTLARELYDEVAERHGVTTVWGFPNDASRPGFVGKLGWFDIHLFPTLVKPIESRHMLRRYLRSPGVSAALGGVADRAWRLFAPRPTEPRRATIREVASFDARFEELWERQRSLARVIQVRDPIYLRWRYCAVSAFGYHPFEVTVAGSLVGYFVLRVLELFRLPFAALVDIFPCPVVDDEITREVLSFAQLFAARERAAFLTALLPPAQAHHLTRFGFLAVPGFLNPRRWYFGCRCSPADVSLLRDVGNWYVTYGDADIV